jgi:RNA polymerase sigma-70 factor (ECF subfamily)
MSQLSANHTLFKAWLEENRGTLVKVTRAYALTAADAADLQQELLLQLWISVPNFNGDAKASTWVYRVFINTALTWRRNTAKHRRWIEPGADPSGFLANANDPAAHADHRELIERLYAAIRIMPGLERALVLLMLDDLSYREMAEITGLTENQVGVGLTRARKRLTGLMKGVIDEVE